MKPPAPGSNKSRIEKLLCAWKPPQPAISNSSVAIDRDRRNLRVTLTWPLVLFPQSPFGNPKIDYIVQLNMETVRLNAMRTFRAPVTGFNARMFFGLFAMMMFALFAQRTFAADTNTTQGYLEAEFQQSQKAFQANTNSAEAAWKFGRACFDMSTLQKDQSIEAKYAQEGMDACRAALTLNPASAPAYYYLGMDLGQLADTKRNLSALKMVKDVERDFLAARKLDKHFDYAGPSRNLGLLYRDAPSIVSIGSRARARQYLEEAVELAPEFPENQLNLIESYFKWDYEKEAQRQFGDLEKIWAAARQKLTGVPWQLSWTDWNKRLETIQKKIDKNPKNESPHSQ
jgi:tetratricopeptide (TPR) repeat protein